MFIGLLVVKKKWIKCGISVQWSPLAIKRDEVLIRATTWMSLENTIQSARSQTQKAKYCDSVYMKCQE